MRHLKLGLGAYVSWWLRTPGEQIYWVDARGVRGRSDAPEPRLRSPPEGLDAKVAEAQDASSRRWLPVGAGGGVGAHDAHPQQRVTLPSISRRAAARA